MFYNDIKCDLYIGTGAGRKLLTDIRNAKKSVKVVSPFLSPKLIKELIDLQHTGIQIELITTDTIEDFYGQYEKNIHKLIIQNREVDRAAIEIRKKWKRISKILTYVDFGLIGILLGLAFLLKEVWIILLAIPIIIIFLIIMIYKNEITSKRIYSYWYSQLFPFKVYISPNSSKLSNTFIHSKIYLIDNRIAYLGSLNFTFSGTTQNYETRVRTTDPSAIKAIKEEIHDLMNNSEIPERDIQLWGKQLYKEPMN